jgi:Fe/S biogenesis protein NfuA
MKEDLWKPENCSKANVEPSSFHGGKAMLTVTDPAKKKILALLEAQGRQDSALRVAITGRGFGAFQYDLRFVEGTTKTPEDVVMDAGGFEVFIDRDSAAKLHGSTLDFIEGVQQSGFQIDNPNPLWDDPKAKAVQDVIDAKVNPSMAMHGGFVTLLDVKDDIAYVALGGGCQGCAMARMTLKQGVEAIILDAVPEIRQVIDTTDHAGGTNPYYQPSKGGGPSPFA